MISPQKNILALYFQEDLKISSISRSIFASNNKMQYCFWEEKEVLDGVRQNVFGMQRTVLYNGMHEFWFYLGEFSRRHLTETS